MRTPTAPTWSRAETDTPPSRRRARGPARALALFACLALPACGGRFDPVEALAPSHDADTAREIGWAFDHELARTVRFVDDPLVAGFAFDLGQAIVRQTGPQPFVYRFRVIRDRSLNAFAVFGGYVYLHSGTVLAAGSLDELAGVVGHEVAHVRHRHHARMAEKMQLPDLLSGLAGLAAVAGAAASGEPGVVVAGQGVQAVNEAIKLRFSRAFEAEADHFGTLYMNAAGYDADGLVTFFERLLAERRRLPFQVPPYLYSHPEVEDRIAAVEIQAGSLPEAHAPHPALRAAFRDAQARLAALEAGGRGSWIEPSASDAAEHAPAALAQAERLRAAEDAAGALAALEAGLAEAPRDPRLSWRAATLLQEMGRHGEAIAHLERTLALDPTRALVFFRLGESHEALGDVARAVYAYEQAEARAGEGSSLRRRAHWEAEKLTFPVVRDVRFAEGASAGDRRLDWSAHLGPHFADHVDRLRVRFRPPGDAAPREVRVRRGDARLVARLALPKPGAAAGTWSAETLLDDDVVDARAARLGAR